MTSKNTDKEAFVWIWLPGATQPVVAGKLETDDLGNIQFNYGKSSTLSACMKTRALYPFMSPNYR